MISKVFMKMKKREVKGEVGEKQERNNIEATATIGRNESKQTGGSHTLTHPGFLTCMSVSKEPCAAQRRYKVSNY